MEAAKEVVVVQLMLWNVPIVGKNLEEKLETPPCDHIKIRMAIVVREDVVI